MPVEQTLALIKPDAVAAGHYGKILDRIAQSDLTIKAIKFKHLSMAEVKGIYRVHAGRFFFPRLTEFVSSGPLFALILEGENAIDTWRLQNEYGYWTARIKDSFRFDSVRRIAHERLAVLDSLIDSLSTHHNGEDLHQALANAKLQT